jgi:ABC-type antimicrobial peptide transport system permease subunit
MPTFGFFAAPPFFIAGIIGAIAFIPGIVLRDLFFAIVFAMLGLRTELLLEFAYAALNRLRFIDTNTRPHYRKSRSNRRKHAH